MSDYLSYSSPDSGEVLRSTDYIRELARIDFLFAMLQVERQQMDIGPLGRLDSEFWPKWHDAMYPLDLVPYGTRPRKHYFYLEHQDLEERKKAAANAILTDWATRCWIVERTATGELKPPAWILDQAAKVCNLRSDEKRRQLSLARWIARPPEDLESPVPPPLRGPDEDELIVPMHDSARLPDESWPQYSKRARRALTIHLRELVLRESLSSRPAKPLRNRKLDHFVWLVLFQCCEWPLERIRQVYPHLSSRQAVWNGLTEKANLLGLAVRPKRALKKTAPKQPKT